MAPRKEKRDMQSETDLLAQWSGEELFAAGRADEELRALHRKRGEFFTDLLRGLRSSQPEREARELRERSEIGRVLDIAFRAHPRERGRH